MRRAFLLGRRKKFTNFFIPPSLGRDREPLKVHAIGKNNFKNLSPYFLWQKIGVPTTEKMKKALTYPKEFLRTTTTKIFKPLTFSADSEAL